MEIDPRLRKLQMAELEILNEFVRICEKHDLTYYLVGGTLLGAVRHQGFIPWDDDIDVAMPRADYDRLVEVCGEDLGAEYFYQSPETDPYYFLTYAKIRKNGTEIYEERFKDARFHKGIFIDVFPLDFCPRPGVVCHLLFNVLAVMNYRGQVDSGEPYEPYKELSGKIGYTLLRLFSPKGLVKVRKGLLRLSARLSDGAWLASYSGAYGYRREVYPAAWFQKGEKVCFEAKAYVGPEKFNIILPHVYGSDYMRLPAKQEKRHISL